MLEPPVILADADNTLWDTDTIFAEAQQTMLTAVERQTGRMAPGRDRLKWVRSFDQGIARVDHRHLRYPPGLLVQALALGLTGTRVREAAAAAVGGRASILPAAVVDAIVNTYAARLQAHPPLLRGVSAGLSAAAAANVDVWVLTEGAAERQRSRIDHHRLTPFIKGVAEVTKTAEQFERQRRRFSPRLLYVVGDQPDRDIAPAREAGCRTVLVPSRFRPDWHDDGAWTEADHVTDSFERAILWILKDAMPSPAASIAAE